MNHHLFKRRRTLTLRDGKIDNGPETLAKIVVFGILHHTHNFENHFRVTRSGLAANPQPYRIRAITKPSRELFIDDGNLWRCNGVFLIKVSARQQWNAERFEIAVPHRVEVRIESGLPIFAIGPDPVVNAIATQWNYSHLRRALRAGNTAKLVEDLLLRRDAAHNREVQPGQVELCNQDAVFSETCINGKQVAKRSGKKQCAGYQNQRQCNLSNDEYPSQPAAFLHSAR